MSLFLRTFILLALGGCAHTGTLAHRLNADNCKVPPAHEAQLTQSVWKEETTHGR